MGLTTEQRAKSLGHSVTMNENIYNKHLGIESDVEFLTTHIQTPQSIIANLTQENIRLKEEIMFLKKTITELEIENEKLKGNNNITKLF